MPWLTVHFDGGDLILARLTRRHKGVRAYQRVGAPTADQVYPCAMRITGLSRLHTWGLLWKLQARFNHGTRARRQGRDLVVQVGIVRDRLQSEQLKLLMQHEHHFDPPLLLYERGRLTVHLHPRPGTDPGRLARRVPGLDVAVVEHVDQSPWAGLDPAIPPSRPLPWLRHPPEAGK